jgi:hypothetical protein
MTTVARALGVARSHLLASVQTRSGAAQALACAADTQQQPARAGGVKEVGGVEGVNLTPPSTTADAELLEEIREELRPTTNGSTG